MKVELHWVDVMASRKKKWVLHGNDQQLGFEQERWKVQACRWSVFSGELTFKSGSCDFKFAHKISSHHFHSVRGANDFRMTSLIIGNEIIGHFKVDDSINTENYCNFLNKTFFDWYRLEPISFKLKHIFMQN